jgi:hypothetical protein
MKTKSLAFSLSLLALLILFPGAHAVAVTIDFTDMNRGPSDPLQIDGVTISGGTYFGLDVGSVPATALGVGLGSATIGSPGTVDRIQTEGSPYLRESLSLTVAGSINSVTITPYFSIIGSNETIFLPFDVSVYFAGTNPTAPYHTVSSDNPISFGPFGSISSTLEIGLQSDFGNIPVILYLHEHPGATAQFGFSIGSLDYTPADVPEVSTVTLFGIGLVGIGLLRRKIMA